VDSHQLTFARGGSGAGDEFLDLQGFHFSNEQPAAPRVNPAAARHPVCGIHGF
jgi:hypothetical protein